MEQYLQNAYNSYFNSLRKLGYVKDNSVKSLLVMTFIYKLLFFECKELVNKKDYHIIEKAINCLYGTRCLLPYIDYLKTVKFYNNPYVNLLNSIWSNSNYTETLNTKLVITEEKIRSLTSNIMDIKDIKVIKTRGNDVEIPDIQF